MTQEKTTEDKISNRKLRYLYNQFKESRENINRELNKIERIITRIWESN